jgi:hypothetical protein
MLRYLIEVKTILNFTVFKFVFTKTTVITNINNNIQDEYTTICWKKIENNSDIGKLLGVLDVKLNKLANT